MLGRPAQTGGMASPESSSNLGRLPWQGNRAPGITSMRAPPEGTAAREKNSRRAQHRSWAVLRMTGLSEPSNHMNPEPMLGFPHHP